MQNMAVPPLFLLPPLENYSKIFSEYPSILFMWNISVVAFGSAGSGFFRGIPAAYAIVHITPGISCLVPWFIIFAQLKLIGIYAALVLSHLTFVLPLISWVMVGLIEDLVLKWEEAALVDGCARWRAFVRVAVPLSAPGVVASSIVWPLSCLGKPSCPPWCWERNDSDLARGGL